MLLKGKTDAYNRVSGRHDNKTIRLTARGAVEKLVGVLAAAM